MAERPLDLHGRPLGVLRLSLTARCNLACPYCCPDSEDPPGLLSLAERVALVEASVGLGVHTLRLTGGEPLLHRRLEELIAALQPLRQRPASDPRGALREIALTSNGVLLSAERARQLKAAGLDRITLSLDGTDGASVARMAGLGSAAAGGSVLEKVLAAIRHAREAGFDPARGELKLNAVITRSGNADQLLPLAGLARELGLELRLIEFMDVGNRNGWNPDQVLPAAEMVARIGAVWPLEPVGRAPHGTASRWRYRDRGNAEEGAVAPTWRWWPRSRPPSAATATACGSPPTGWPTAVCSPAAAPTCGPGCGPGPIRPGCGRRWRPCGGPAATAGARSAGKRPTSDRRRRRWPTWGAERPGRRGPGSAGPPERSSPSGGWRPARCPRRRRSTRGTDAGAGRRHR